MFAVLGNPQAQAVIRASNGDKHHCHLLKLSANACTELPQAFADLNIPAGAVCPNNPYNRESAALAKSEWHQRLLGFTVDAHRNMRVGGLTDAAPRIEVVVAYLYQRWLEDRPWLKP